MVFAYETRLQIRRLVSLKCSIDLSRGTFLENKISYCFYLYQFVASVVICHNFYQQCHLSSVKPIDILYFVRKLQDYLKKKNFQRFVLKRKKIIIFKYIKILKYKFIKYEIWKFVVKKIALIFYCQLSALDG